MPTITLACCAAAPLSAGACLAVTPRPGIYAAAAAAEAKPLPPAQRLERRFLQITASNLRFQSEASRLALARSNNPAVKDLANTLLARQQAVQPELLRLLHTRGMALPMPTNAHGKTLKRLARLNGAKFDRLYVDEVVMRSSQDDIANYEKVAAHAEDPVLKAWIARQLPTLRFHFTKAGKALPSASLHGQRAV
jgi:putative membrane protein